MLCRFIAFALLTLAAPLSRAQQALPQELGPSVEVVTERDEIPAKAWLDLRQNAPMTSKTQTAPGWVESVGMGEARVVDGVVKSVFRIRVSKPFGDYNVLFFRLFFDDKADARPELVGWDESGTQVLRSRALGSGIDLPTSDTVMIPMHEITAIDVEVPGDGSTVRAVYLDWMASTEVLMPLSTEHRDVIAEPFSSLPRLRAPEQDVEQFGTVTATLAPGTIHLGANVEQGAAFQFGMEAQPLVALLTFEVASPRIDSPPEVYVNGENVGPVNLTLPELADPGYRGEMESLVKEMRFHYTGWLRAQKVVPASNLKIGTNDIVIISGAGTSTSAIRGTQIQLKYLWDKTDYLLRTPAGN